MWAESRYPVELALCLHGRGESGKAMQYVQRAEQQFLGQWRGLRPVSGKLRRSMLTSLQTLAEVSNFLSPALSDGMRGAQSLTDPSAAAAAARSQLAEWHSSSPLAQDPLTRCSIS